jgi:hypothetical protein
VGRKTDLDAILRRNGVDPRWLQIAAKDWDKWDAYAAAAAANGEEVGGDGFIRFVLGGSMMPATRRKADLDSLCDRLREAGWNPELTPESYRLIIDCGLRSKNLELAAVATQIALGEQPITLRGLMYRVVSAGWLPSTDKQHYTRLGRIMTTLRERGVVPFEWIVDNVRTTDKPSSWSGLEDFAETVKRAYRKDFWASLSDYVHVIVEKDAIAGVLAPTTREYDVALSPIRGYVSLSFAHSIASTWNQIEKPVWCYYLGDFDASGFDLERDVREKLSRYCERPFAWMRLGVNADDFAEFDLIPLAAKKTDARYRRFVREHGEACAELDALPATELRRRVEQAIVSHIDMPKWERLKETERVERESLGKIKLFSA